MGSESSQMNGSGDHGVTGVELTWKRVDVGTEFPPRDGHCACSCAGKMFVFGGVVQTGSSGEHRESNDLLVFDPVRQTFEKVVGSGCVPRPRSAATLAAVNSKLYLFGGLSNDIGWLNDLHVFDTETNTWSKLTPSGNAPSPRDKLTSAVIGPSVYFFGGFGPKASSDTDDEDEDEGDDDDDVRAIRTQQRAAQFGWFDDLFIFNTATNTWSQPMHMNTGGPTPRAAHTLCSVGQLLVIFGGRDAESRTDDLHIYDTVSRKWVAGPIVSRQVEPRSFHAACTVGNRIAVVGGRGLQDQHFNDLHVFDIESKAWCKPAVTGDVVPARGSHSLVSVDSNSVVLFGGSSDFNRNAGHCTKYYNDIYVMNTNVSCVSTATGAAVGNHCAAGSSAN